MIDLVMEICEAKRGRVYPVLATEVELKHELSRRGVSYTAESFRSMCNQLDGDPRIVTIRTLNHRAYAYITEEQQEGLLTEERGAGTTTACQHSILSKPAVAQGKEAISRATSAMRGVSAEGSDNPSNDSGSHHDDQYWWCKI